MNNVRDVRFYLRRESLSSVNDTYGIRISSRMTESAFLKPQSKYINFS